MTKLLELKDVHVKYGYIEALKGIDCEVNEGRQINDAKSNYSHHSSERRENIFRRRRYHEYLSGKNGFAKNNTCAGRT